MIVKFDNKNISKIGYLLGVLYSIFFNSIIGGYNNDFVGAFVYSLPFMLFAFLIGFAISRYRKDKLSGVYFLVTCLTLVSAQ